MTKEACLLPSKVACGRAWVRYRLTFLDQLALCIKFSKYFPVYVCMSVQSNVVHFCKLFGTPKRPESGCYRSAGGRRSVVGNVASASFLLLLRSGKDHKQCLLLFSWQAATIID